jgi:hypothetical protein
VGETNETTDEGSETSWNSVRPVAMASIATSGDTRASRLGDSAVPAIAIALSAATTA